MSNKHVYRHIITGKVGEYNSEMALDLADVLIPVEQEPPVILEDEAEADPEGIVEANNDEGDYGYGE